MEVLLSPLTFIVIWAILLAVFVVVEVATINLVTVWFAVGALAALIASLVTNNFIYQIVIFLVVSFVALVVTKPMMDRARKAKPVARVELDRNLGRTAQALETIQPGRTGRVRLDGVDWNATSDDVIVAGSNCVVTAIHGTTLTVAAAKDTAAV